MKELYHYLCRFCDTESDDYPEDEIGAIIPEGWDYSETIGLRCPECTRLNKD